MVYQFTVVTVAVGWMIQNEYDYREIIESKMPGDI
jgi:hypothetical protein